MSICIQFRVHILDLRRKKFRRIYFPFTHQKQKICDQWLLIHTQIRLHRRFLALAFALQSADFRLKTSLDLWHYVDDHDCFDGNPMRFGSWNNLRSRKELHVNLYSEFTFGLTQTKEISLNFHLAVALPMQKLFDTNFNSHKRFSSARLCSSFSTFNPLLRYGKIWCQPSMNGFSTLEQNPNAGNFREFPVFDLGSSFVNAVFRDFVSIFQFLAFQLVLVSIRSQAENFIHPF